MRSYIRCSLTVAENNPCGDIKKPFPRGDKRRRFVSLSLSPSPSLSLSLYLSVIKYLPLERPLCEKVRSPEAQVQKLDPRVHFGLVCSPQCQYLRVYTSETVNSNLNEAYVFPRLAHVCVRPCDWRQVAARFCADNVSVDLAKRRVSLPIVFKLFLADFTKTRREDLSVSLSPSLRSSPPGRHQRPAKVDPAPSASAGGGRSAAAVDDERLRQGELDLVRSLLFALPPLLGTVLTQPAAEPIAASTPAIQTWRNSTTLWKTSCNLYCVRMQVDICMYVGNKTLSIYV